MLYFHMDADVYCQSGTANEWTQLDRGSHLWVQDEQEDT